MLSERLETGTPHLEDPLVHLGYS